MGAVAKNDNVKQRNKKKNSATKQKFGKQGRNGVHPQAHSRPHPPLGNRQFPPRFALGIGMRSRPPFPPGMRPPPPPGIGMRPPPPPPPGMRPPPPGMRMPPPPPLFRNRAPMPPRPLIPPPGPKMGPRGPPPPPMQLRSRNRPPLMGPPPLMRPPPPMMGPRPRRFPPPPPPPMLPPSKMRQLKNKIQHPRKNKRKQILNPVDLSSPWVTVDIKKAFDDKDTMYLAAKASSKPEDWDKFKEQRSKCEKMYKAAKLEYIGKHPEEVVSDNSEESSEENENDYTDYQNEFSSGYETNEYLENQKYQENQENSENAANTENSEYSDYSNSDQDPKFEYNEGSKSEYNQDPKSEYNQDSESDYSEYYQYYQNYYYSEGQQENSESDYSEYYQYYQNYYYSEDQQEEPESTPEFEFFCDACERAFQSKYQLDNHMKEHRVCGIDGCQFVAHAKIVEKHIDMQHVTGLYYRIAQTNTPEDIKKWIEERKRRYPTKENVEKRRKAQEEMFKRGERIQKPKDRFGKKTKKDRPEPRTKRNRRNTKSKLSKRKIVQIEVPAPVSVFDDKSSWNGNLPPFSGTGELYEQEEITEEIFDDTEWGEETTAAPKIELDNALGALIGAYMSSDDEDQEISIPKKFQEPETQPLEKNEDDEPPDEQKIVKQDVGPGIEEAPKNKHERSRKRKRRGRIEPRKKVVKQNSSFKNQTLVRRKITLLEKLLEPDIRHERNVILQCVRYVVGKNYFQKESVEEETQIKIREEETPVKIPEEEIVDPGISEEGVV